MNVAVTPRTRNLLPVPSPRRLVPAALAALLLSLLVGAAPSTAAPLRADGSVRQAAEFARVVVISVDGLNPVAIRRLGVTGTPTYHRLMNEGAWTFNARTAYEQTVTLPNHTGMLTSRRVERTRVATA